MAKFNYSADFVDGARVFTAFAIDTRRGLETAQKFTKIRDTDRYTDNHASRATLLACPPMMVETQSGWQEISLEDILVLDLAQGSVRVYSDQEFYKIFQSVQFSRVDVIPWDRASAS